ncbi:MAG TPA: ABC transporter permease [Bryobacteraceae bacterium]|nr:ABC transporter permease [Bryobacteraceae bacterium]
MKPGELWRRIGFLRRGRQFDAEMEEELRFHAAMKAAAYRADGADAREAHHAAMRRLGNPAELKEKSRDMWGWRWLEAFAQDSRYAFRVLRKSPAFTLIAVVSLALGIGANTVVFSVLNALVLKALPIADAARVYFVNNSGGPGQSFPNYRDIRDRNAVFESLFAYRVAMMSLDDDRGAHRVWGYLVTGNYFESLGIKPALGRFFTPAEDMHPNASPYAVISHACWRNRFGGDPQIAGKNIRINSHSYTVLGVAPREFHGTEDFYWSEIWVPMTMQPQIEGHSWLEDRYSRNSWVAGRLKPGVTVKQAEANLGMFAAQLAHDYTVNEGMRLTLSVPGMVGSAGREPTQAFAGGIMLLAALVLLAACANLASLLAARMADRSRDLAIRVSIGAGAGRIVRQLLTESLWIAMLGGAAGCALAVALLQLLSQWHAPLEFPVQFDVTPDWRVFLFACLAALATALLFGIGSARHAWKADPALHLKGTATPRSGRRWAARDILLPVQIALCCVLLTASLVAVRGLMRSFQTPLGFRPDGASVIGYDVGLAGYNEDQGRVFEQRALQAVAHLPGVESAAYSSSVPLSIDQSNTTVYSESTTDFRPKNAQAASFYKVAPGYFQTAGTRLAAGREFTPQDNPNSPRVAIVNQTFARSVTGAANAIGRRFRRGSGGPLFQIVAVVEDGKYETLTESPKPAVFFPILQDYSSTIVLMARSHRPEPELAAEMRDAIARLDSHLAVFGVGSLHQMLGLVYLPMHAAVVALGAFGVLALMLSITGIYGLAAYTVSRRVREIGIRVAIGARPAQVLRLIFARTGMLVAIGAAAGLALGIAGASVLASIVYQASSRDPLVIGAAVLAISCVGLAAAAGPARRALRIDPVQALRHE